jgi:hypothetical protein
MPLAAFVLACLATAGAPLGRSADAIAPASTTDLFNGRDLSGWVVFGRDNDPAAKTTWSVNDGVLTATGSPFGYIRTEKQYRDYRLHVEWRWVPGDPPVDDQGRPRNRNSGVLLHLQGEDKVWPDCIEAQLQINNAGDFIAMGSNAFDELLAARETAAAAAGDDEAKRRQATSMRRLARRHDSSERPVGEWNTYEIVCRGDTATLTVNGILQNSATGLSVREGRLGFQSEGMPVEFRVIRLEPLGAP